MATDNLKLKFFATYIEAQIGIIYSETNYFQLEHRLNDIVTLLGCKDLDDLWLRAQSGIDTQLRDLLLDLATNNETSFFRDAAIFEALVKNIIPDLKTRNPNQSFISLWSAAGSTGQEAYSAAMALDQARKTDPTFPTFDIFVSDISERVLSRAKEGKYTQLEVQRGMSARLLIEYFDNAGENIWLVKPRLAGTLRFKKLNLLEELPSSIGIFDIIFCRNVLIYQSVENKITIVNRLLKHLPTNGYLIMGAAESMLGVSSAVRQLQFGTAVVYQKI